MALLSSPTQCLELTLFSKSLSVSGYAYNQLRLLTLDKLSQNGEIKICQYERKRKKQVSSNEALFAWDMMTKYDDADIITNWSSPERAKILHQFKVCKPDVFLPNTNPPECWLFNECRIHSHNRSCTLVNYDRTGPGYKKNSRHWMEIQEKFQREYPQYCLKVAWECKFIKSEAYQNSLSSPIHLPVKTFSVRDSQKEGLFQTFHFHYNAEEHPNESMFCMDFSSLYPITAMKVELPVGKWEFLGNLVNADIRFVNGKHYLNQETELVGIFVVQVECPTGPKDNFDFPFISSKARGRKVYTFCQKCVEERNPNFCQCQDQERRFFDTLCTNELNFAASLGFRFVFFEGINYGAKKICFDDFFKFFLAEKVKYSGFPIGTNSDEEKQEFINGLNFDLNLEGNLKIKVDDVVFNPIRRELAKKICNTAIGKLSLNSKNFTETKLTSNPYDLFEASRNKSLINYSIQGDKCELVLQKKEPPIMRNCNSVFGSFIVAESRIAMFKHLQNLHKTGCTIYQVSCDAIYFTKPNDKPMPLPIRHDTVGFFRSIYPDKSEICEFVSINARFFSITYKLGGEIKTDNKLSGIKVDNDDDHFSTPKLKTYLDALISDQSTTLTAPKQRRIKRQKTSHFFYETKYMSFSKDLYASRQPIEGSYRTRSYGICAPWLQK